MDAGIDYGCGQYNIDQATGIRYGVIHANEVGDAWYDVAVPDYGKPTCGHCGYEFKQEPANSRIRCPKCKKVSQDWEVYPEEARQYYYDKEGYEILQMSDGDLFVSKSPYYTFCNFCSPSAPGAGYLLSENSNGVKTYCLGPEWFEDSAPYTIHRISDDSLILPVDALEVEE